MFTASIKLKMPPCASPQAEGAPSNSAVTRALPLERKARSPVQKDLRQACGTAGIGLCVVLSRGTMTACGGEGSEPGTTGNNHGGDREGQAGRAVTKDGGSMLETDGREQWQGIHMNEGKCKHVTRAGGVGGS